MQMMLGASQKRTQRLEAQLAQVQQAEASGTATPAGVTASSAATPVVVVGT